MSRADEARPVNHEALVWISGLATGLFLAIPLGLIVDRFLELLTRPADDRRS